MKHLSHSVESGWLDYLRGKDASLGGRQMGMTFFFPASRLCPAARGAQRPPQKIEWAQDLLKKVRE